MNKIKHIILIECNIDSGDRTVEPYLRIDFLASLTHLKSKISEAASNTARPFSYILCFNNVEFCNFPTIW